MRAGWRVRWQVQEAKQRFSEVVRAAESGEPQFVTKHGEEVVVMISIAEYHRLSGETESLMGYLRAEPLVDVGFQVERPRDLPREIDLAG
jgi:prevent-host-death family protein